MAEEVILLSSEDEDVFESPTKKFKRIKLDLPHVSLSIVDKKENNKTIIETVSLDSDEDEFTDLKIDHSTKPLEIISNEGSALEESGMLVTNISTVNNGDLSDNGVETVEKCSVTTTDFDNKMNFILNEIVDENSSSAILINGLDNGKEEKENQLDKVQLGFVDFLTLVKDKLKGSPFQEALSTKIPIIKKYYKKNIDFAKEGEFYNTLQDTISTLKDSPEIDSAHNAIIAFHKIFQSLKSYHNEKTIIIEEDHLPKVKRMEKLIRALRRRIKRLETTEVDFDAGGRSSYLILDKYQRHLKQIYTRYCKYIRRNPRKGRPLYDRISIKASRFEEINQALSKKYKNSVKFPSYYDLEKFIRKFVNTSNLALTEQEIKNESEKCFKHLGKILQKKRRQELSDSHLDIVQFSEDPSKKDIALDNVLKKNYLKGKERIDRLCEEYVKKQEQGDDHVSSYDENCSGNKDTSNDTTDSDEESD
ncbi:hypothetical protein ABEB36_006317 [Hypothenemus hampei]|uniref:Daxx histone-binding domain-containing protein n=1 Tax=Hypothenemus hampei TaxID=57062 RepID=A0ABD1EQ49_HYPHA